MNNEIFIFVPLYNAESFIDVCIQSVLVQTYQSWQLLIIDDCSTDNSYQKAKRYEKIDPRIKVLKNERNMGTFGNWNQGIKHCTSDYFVKLDADDFWAKDFLEKSYNIIRRYENVGIVFTKCINVDVNGEVLWNTEIPLPGFAKNKYFSCVDLVKLGPNKMFMYPILRQGASIMRSKLFKELGDLKNIKSHDTEFFYRVGCHYDIFCIDEVLYYYRVHPNSDSALISKKGLRQKLLLEVNEEIIRYYFENKKLTKREFSAFSKQIEFYRKVTDLFSKEGKGGQFIRQLLKIFISYPVSFSDWLLYVLKNKIKGFAKTSN